MSTRTMTMFSNDFGLNRDRASPLLRVTKPANHLFEAVMALTDSLFQGAERTASAIRTWNRRRRTEAELAQLDERLLRDIGLTRDGVSGRVMPIERSRYFEVERTGRF